jgi:hypothetical protein
MTAAFPLHNEAAPGAGTAGAAGSHAFPQERTSSMAKVKQPEPGGHRPARSRRVPPPASPRLIEEAVRVFLALGITAADLRLRAMPGSVLVELADAMDSPVGTS